MNIVKSCLIYSFIDIFSIKIFNEDRFENIVSKIDVITDQTKNRGKSIMEEIVEFANCYPNCLLMQQR